MFLNLAHASHYKIFNRPHFCTAFVHANVSQSASLLYSFCAHRGLSIGLTSVQFLRTLQIFNLAYFCTAFARRSVSNQRHICTAFAHNDVFQSDSFHYSNLRTATFLNRPHFCTAFLHSANFQSDALLYSFFAHSTHTQIFNLARFQERLSKSASYLCSFLRTVREAFSQQFSQIISLISVQLCAHDVFQWDAYLARRKTLHGCPALAEGRSRHYSYTTGLPTVHTA